MKLIRELSHLPALEHPCVLTIGNFDGMHLGHQALIQKLVHQAKINGLPSIVLSFENHPAEVLRPEISICKICSTDHKIRLMEAMGVDYLVLLTFTKEFAEQTAEAFLQSLQTILPFSLLILGWDATLGKNKKGNKDVVQAIAQKNYFSVEYLDQQIMDGLSISSSQVRKFIENGKLDETKNFLGRHYSIYSTVYQGEGKGKKLGFPTANINVKGLCLPPLGVYAVSAFIDEKPHLGVANLGIAPTIRNDRNPVLEVHIFDYDKDLYGKAIEVVFLTFLRPEKKFSSIDELKSQIQNDILLAKQNSKQL